MGKWMSIPLFTIFFLFLLFVFTKKETMAEQLYVFDSFL